MSSADQSEDMSHSGSDTSVNLGAGEAGVTPNAAHDPEPLCPFQVYDACHVCSVLTARSCAICSRPTCTSHLCPPGEYQDICPECYKADSSVANQQRDKDAESCDPCLHAEATHRADVVEPARQVATKSHFGQACITQVIVWPGVENPADFDLTDSSGVGNPDVSSQHCTNVGANSSSKPCLVNSSPC